MTSLQTGVVQNKSIILYYTIIFDDDYDDKDLAGKELSGIYNTITAVNVIDKINGKTATPEQDVESSASNPE